MSVGSATTLSSVVLFVVRLLKERMVISSEISLHGVLEYRRKIRKPISNLIKEKDREEFSRERDGVKQFSDEGGLLCSSQK